MNNSTNTAEGRPLDSRRRVQFLVIGFILTVFLIGAIIWGTSQSSNHRPEGLAGSSTGVVATPTPTATPTETAMQSLPGGTTAPASPASAPAPEPTAASPAPAPATGSDAQLANVDQPVAPPVPLDQPASIREGITAEITEFESVQGQAQKAGEVAGPSLRFTVTLHNSTDRPLTTADVVVNVSAGAEDLPSITLSGPDVSEFPPTIAPGESGSATYVFLVPVDQRDKVRVLVNFQVDSPIAAFEGAAPTEGKP
jgi:hypothetical protein